jgi:WD40 repeat protein
VLWDTRTGRTVVHIEPEAQETGTGRVVFVPDGRKLVAVGTGFVRVHDTATGELLAYSERSRRGHIEISLDGRRLMSIGPDHALEILDLDTGQLLTRERVGLVGEDGSVTWPIPPRELTRIACTRLRVFARAYPAAHDICDPLLEG